MYAESMPYQRQPSKWQQLGRRAGMGFMYGGSLGVTAGFVFGGLHAMSLPRGNRTFTVARTSAMFGASFGIIVAVGFIIRS